MTVMIKGSIQEEDITIINIYAPNVGAPQYVRQMLTSMKGEINTNTIIVGDFNTPLTPMCIPQPFAWGGLWKLWEARRGESGAVGLAAGWGHLRVKRSS